jgi:hypothetical protein
VSISDATIIAKIFTSISHRAASDSIDVDAIFKKNLVVLMLSIAHLLVLNESFENFVRVKSKHGSG